MTLILPFSEISPGKKAAVIFYLPMAKFVNDSLTFS